MIELIPAIDLIDGKCVRLIKGDYTTQKIYSENPVDVALEVEAYGFTRLHVVDLDGARSEHIMNHRILKDITNRTSLKVDFGGGIKSDADIDCAFSNGADMVTIGSIAVSRPELFSEWLVKYGAEKIILGADVKDGIISINGWQESGGIQLMPFLKNYIEKGVINVLCTDIGKDGTLKGPALSLYKSIMEACPCHLIASGGVSSLKDIESLDEAGIPAVVFGKAIYEAKISLKELASWAKLI